MEINRLSLQSSSRAKMLTHLLGTGGGGVVVDDVYLVPHLASNSDFFDSLIDLCTEHWHLGAKPTSVQVVDHARSSCVIPPQSQHTTWGQSSQPAESMAAWGPHLFQNAITPFQVNVPDIDLQQGLSRHTVHRVGLDGHHARRTNCVNGSCIAQSQHGMPLASLQP
jgi:hypothetical protein